MATPDDRKSPPASPASPSAFHSFLDHDPFPSNRDRERPLSAASNATSDFNVSTRYSNIPAITGPVGEPGLPPSRPTSGNANSERSNRTSLPPAPSSRRGVGMFGKDGSRPGSAVEKTHVPSLTPQRFFRPMSPQALQVQRGQNIQAAGSINQRIGRSSDGTQSRRRRNSDASVNTMRDGYLANSAESDVPPLPSSRGTHATVPRFQDESYDVQDSTWTGSVESKNSVSPLYATLNPDPNDYPPSATNASFPPNSPSLYPPRSPLSLRSPFGMHSRQQSKKDIHERKPSSNGHEKLPSNPESPIAFLKEKQQIVAPKPARKTKLGRNYEYFDGNILFLLSGRLINTKARPLNLVTLILALIPGALFSAFSAPWLWLNVSPAIPIVFAYVFVLTLGSFFNAAFSDPGILPKNLHPHPPNPEEERDPLTPGPATTEWVMVKTYAQKQGSQESAAENGASGAVPTTAMEVPTKYCKSCKIWRPPRAHHCRVCDACVETQDHHCVWLNNCVGRRNYRYFFAFVGYASLLALTVIAFTLTHIILYAQRNHIPFRDSITGRYQERIAFSMFIYSVLALPYPGSLFFYHVFLVARGETTREYLNSHKFQPKDRHRPFSQSSMGKNWMSVLLRPRSISYMDFSKKYVEGDLRYGHTMRKRDRRAQANIDQRNSEARVEKLKNQFSIPTGRASNDATDGGLEMKPLPPPPTQPVHGGAPRSDNLSTANGGNHLRVDAPLNSTPRL